MEEQDKMGFKVGDRVSFAPGRRKGKIVKWCGISDKFAVEASNGQIHWRRPTKIKKLAKEESHVISKPDSTIETTVYPLSKEERRNLSAEASKIPDIFINYPKKEPEEKQEKIPIAKKVDYLEEEILRWKNIIIQAEYTIKENTELIEICKNNIKDNEKRVLQSISDVVREKLGDKETIQEIQTILSCGVRVK